MNFLSLDFSLYFFAFFLVYWLLRPYIQVQNLLLITVSYFFVYSFSVSSAVVLFIYSISIYLLARLVTWRHAQDKSIRIVYNLLIALILIFFILFKYYTPSRESLSLYMQQIGLSIDMPILNFLVPLGLSFYIFHSVSYIISLCKKEIEATSLPNLLLYLCFFPSIVAGPIHRAKVFLPQIQNTRELKDINRAIALIVWAITKLFLGSGYLAENFVNDVFDLPEGAESLDILIAIYAYAWQIYFNFSGYTSLVTGIALLLGFQVPQNFDSAYLAQNLQDFWKRWHISLSRFIRDYVYIPLGGNRGGFARQNANLLIAMVISGVWHGAGFNFIVWGFLHGIGLVILKMKDRYCPALPWNTNNGMNQFVARFITFHYICFAWIFFRATDLNSSIEILKGLSQLSFSSLFTDPNAIFVWIFMLLLAIYPIWRPIKTQLISTIEKMPWYIYPIPLVLFLTVVFVLSPDGVPGFIYANF